MEIENKIKNSISPSCWMLLQSISEIAHSHNMSIYLIGGILRDIIINYQSSLADLDIVIEGNALVLSDALKQIYGGSVKKHQAFYTATWNLQTIQERFKEVDDIPSIIKIPKTIDLITARKEIYPYPASLPVVYPSDIMDDLARRDFSINTLALRIDTNKYLQFLDNFNGTNDISSQKIRTLHEQSFRDDPTRMFRAARYAARYSYHLETSTFNGLENNLKYIQYLSPDRIKHELSHIFRENNSYMMMCLLDEWGILREIHPHLKWDKKYHINNNLLSQYFPNDVESRELFFLSLWFHGHSEPTLKEICQRLNISPNSLTIIREVREIGLTSHGLNREKRSLITQKLDKYKKVSLRIAQLIIDDDKIRQIIDLYLSSWCNIHPFTTGKELLLKGIPPGPLYHEILSELRNAWLDGRVASYQEEILLLECIIINMNNK